MNNDSTSLTNTNELRALLARQLIGDTEKLPLSSTQQRLWLLDQIEPNNPRYNVPSVLLLTGALNMHALQQALKTVVARHESLRARFVNDDGAPAQVIGSEDDFQLRQFDVANLPPPERDATAKRLIEEEARHPFNLREDLPIRATVVRLSAAEHILIINMHHIISDEWSFDLFYDELQALYSGLIAGCCAPLPELPLQFSDYAAWQQDWLQSEECRQQLEFWKEHLAGNPPPVNFPADYPRRPDYISKGALCSILLPREFRASLRQLASCYRATPFMWLLGALYALLYRCTGQSDIIIGTPMACRNRVETENVIGCFSNMLPLRTRVSGDLTFAELLGRVRETVLGACSNQDLPLDKIVDALQPERTPGQTPYINVLFIFQEDVKPVELAGLQSMLLDPGASAAKFDLTFFVADVQDGIDFEIEYNADLFAPETMAGLIRNCEEMLRASVENPTMPIAEMKLNQASAQEVQHDRPASTRFQLLDHWFQMRQQQNQTLQIQGGAHEPRG